MPVFWTYSMAGQHVKFPEATSASSREDLLRFPALLVFLFNKQNQEGESRVFSFREANVECFFTVSKLLLMCRGRRRVSWRGQRRSNLPQGCLSGFWRGHPPLTEGVRGRGGRERQRGESRGVICRQDVRPSVRFPPLPLSLLPPLPPLLKPPS